LKMRDAPRLNLLSARITLVWYTHPSVTSFLLVLFVESEGTLECKISMSKEKLTVRKFHISAIFDGFVHLNRGRFVVNGRRRDNSAGGI
jgi:hypothetical protein